MLRKHIWIGLLVLALTLVLAACAQQAAPAAPAQPAAPTTAPAKAAEAPKATEAPKAAAPTAAPAAPKATDAPKAAAPTTAAAAAPAAGAKNTLIDIAVGDENDNGWNKAHIEATTSVSKQRGWDYVAYKNLNPANPAKPVCENVVEELIGQAKKTNPNGKILVRFNSDDFIPCAEAVAKKHPEVFVDHISGDHVLKGGAPTNLTNNMGTMEYAKILAGCAAANLTKSGQIAYLNGPDNAETRRFFNSFAWGAQYCGKKLNKDVKATNLILGFWFPIPGQTNDPQQLLGQARALGADVFASGIDTQDALQFAKALKDKGETAYSFPYDYLPACTAAPNSCAGIPFFNWVPEVNYVMDMVEKGPWKSEFKMWDPDWKNVFTANTPVGFSPGTAISDEAKAAVTALAADLASGKVKPFQGPVNWADGSVWVAEGSAPKLIPDVWYTEKLIQGTQAFGK
ncbi:MAG: BMP family ABC transporter substrate-binding protein [Anaerolineae bacterium]